MPFAYQFNSPETDLSDKFFNGLSWDAVNEKGQLGQDAAGSGLADFINNRFLFLAAFALQIGGTAGDDLFKFAAAGLATFSNNALGVTQTDLRGFLLQNNTPAAAGSQQISPAVRWSGKGWKTNAVAQSQDVSFRCYILPVEGAANPTVIWILQSSINGATYQTKVTINSSGQVDFFNAGGTNIFQFRSTGESVQTGTNNATNFSASNTGLFFWVGRSVVKSTANGLITISNNAETGFDALIFGQATNAFPRIRINGSILEFRKGDDSAYTNIRAQKITAGSDSGSDESSAILEATSTTRGFLPPRMTGLQADAYSAGTVADGMIIHVTDNTSVTGFVEGVYSYDGTDWNGL